MKKRPYVLIKDVRGGFRTFVIGGNGKTVMHSEVLKSPKAVRINIEACVKCFEGFAAQTQYNGKNARLLRDYAML